MRGYVFMLFVFCLLIAGCGKAVNPYESEFSCPPPEKGKCVGIPEAYKESLQQSEMRNYNLAKEAFSSGREKKKEEGKGGPEEGFTGGYLLLSPAERQYVESLYGVLTKLLKNPRTPVIMPPKVVRVLILPYEGEGGKNLYSARYIYVIVEDARWVLHNVLTSEIIPER